MNDLPQGIAWVYVGNVTWFGKQRDTVQSSVQSVCLIIFITAE